jgi:predicted tellurium resistance membrane protein TerC
MADLIMSLDNTLAIAAIADGNYVLLILGLELSVPLIICGSQLLVKVMNKFPVIVYVGAGLIAWTAGDLIVHDQQIGGYIKALTADWSANLFAVGMLAIIAYWKSKANEDQSDLNENSEEPPEYI